MKDIVPMLEKLEKKKKKKENVPEGPVRYINYQIKFLIKVLKI